MQEEMEGIGDGVDVSKRTRKENTAWNQETGNEGKQRRRRKEKKEKKKERKK